MLRNDNPFTLIAGPCVIESLDHCMKMAKAIKEITDKLNIPLIFKSSYDKANRTSLNAFRGVGIDRGCNILHSIKEEINSPEDENPMLVITDVHSVEELKHYGLENSINMLQIPAFLCRQTDLIIAASKTFKTVMVKKGQFLAPGAMKHVVEKFKSTGNNNIILCERGSTFGHGDLVVDYRGIVTMKEFAPVVFDATHSVQQAAGSFTSGNREMVPYLAKAAIAVGVAGIFMEVHDDPDNAPSDGANMVRLDKLEEILIELKAIDEVVK